MRDGHEFSNFGRSLLYCGAFVVTVAGLWAASDIVVPVLLAVFFSVVCFPAFKYLEQRMPFGLALSIVMLGVIGLFFAIPVFIGGSLRQLVGALPQLQEKLRVFEATVVGYLEEWDLGISSEALMSAFDPQSVGDMLGGFLNGLLQTFSDGIVVLIMIAFMLTESSWFWSKLSLVDRSSGDGVKQTVRILANVRRYVIIKAGVSLATGVCIWLGLLAFGVKYAAVWGFIAFLLNFIPTIGSIIAGIPPVLLALVEHGVGMALGVGGLYLAVNQVFGNLIEPRWQGQGLGLSPLIVFISLFFWGWVLGPVGMLLSAPLTMVVKIALEEHPETQWIAIMLGGKPKMERAETAKETP